MLNIDNGPYSVNEIGTKCLASIIVHTNSNVDNFEVLNVFIQYLYVNEELTFCILNAILKIINYANVNNQLEEIIFIADEVTQESITKNDECEELIHIICLHFDNLLQYE